jgi:hypothetical protein
MSDRQKYRVSGYEPVGDPGTVVFTFEPNGLQYERGQGGVPRRVPQFIVSVRRRPDGLDFDWSGSPDNPGPAVDEIQRDIGTRMQERVVWIDRVNELVGIVERWARALGWSTRRVEKKLDDARVVTHRVPALLMQEETCKIILEPVGRSVPGAEGLVDLYLLPGYDDIASLYFYDGRWNLHYLLPDQKAVASPREAAALPLNQESLGQVLTEMKQHAT